MPHVTSERERVKRSIKRESAMRLARRASIFKYKIVITLPPWGVLVMAGAIGIALLSGPMLVTNIVAITTTVVALTLVYVARKQVGALRHDVHEALNNINNDNLETLHEVPPVDGPEPIRLKRVNNYPNSRVSE
jgi:hypothetical protein